MPNKLTNEQFIEKSIKLFGLKYDYSKVNYIKAKVYVKLICPIHGEFSQTPDKHLHSNLGCPQCGNTLRSIKHRNTDLCSFEIKSKKIHGDKYEYLNLHLGKATIRCPKHGIFTQLSNNHLLGNICPQCSQEKRCLSTEEWITKSVLVHGERYDYSNSIYTVGKNKIKIICSDHGEFLQEARRHLEGKGCPKCKTYKGEQRIILWLKEKGYKYYPQKYFEDCINPKTNKHLKYDFYLPDFNLLIECDGPQHRNPNSFISSKIDAYERYYKQLYRDAIKEKYALDKGVILVRIEYKKVEKLPHQLEAIFNSLNKL